MNDEKITDWQEKYQAEVMDIYSVRLTSWHARMARRIGMGNLARGIRIALEKMSKEEGVK